MAWHCTLKITVCMLCRYNPRGRYKIRLWKILCGQYTELPLSLRLLPSLSEESDSSTSTSLDVYTSIEFCASSQWHNDIVFFKVLTMHTHTDCAVQKEWEEVSMRTIVYPCLRWDRSVGCSVSNSMEWKLPCLACSFETNDHDIDIVMNMTYKWCAAIGL